MKNLGHCVSALNSSFIYTPYSPIDHMVVTSILVNYCNIIEIVCFCWMILNFPVNISFIKICILNATLLKNMKLQNKIRFCRTQNNFSILKGKVKLSEAGVIINSADAETMSISIKKIGFKTSRRSNLKFFSKFSPE